MKGARTPVGYTIIEVMIVLAVSGVMFLIAADFISGKQETTIFPQGVNGLAANLQDTIAQVSDGQYSDIDFTCNFSYGAGQVSIGTSAEQTHTNSATNDVQGTNPQCVFLGKAVQFDENVGGGDISAQQYETFSIAGGRLDSQEQPITTLANAAPTAIDTPTFTLTTQSIVPEHLNVIDMGVAQVGSASPSITQRSYGLGLIDSLGSTGQPGTSDGAQPIGLYYVAGWNTALSETAATNTYPINGTSLQPVPSGDEMVMCVTDYSQYAYIEVGSANNQLNVTVKMLGHNSCS